MASLPGEADTDFAYWKPLLKTNAMRLGTALPRLSRNPCATEHVPFRFVPLSELHLLMSLPEILAAASKADSAKYDLKGTQNVLVGYSAPHLAAKMYSLQQKEEPASALNAYDIRPWYQPKVNLCTRGICGFEASARWHHRTDGILKPAMFLEDVTHYKLQLELTNSMGRQVLQQLCDRREQWFSPLPVSTNISLEMLALEETSDDRFVGLSEYLDAANRINMVTTEKVFSSCIATAVRNSIRKIEEHAVQIVIDDFESFKRLRECPIHELKVDPSFANHIGKSDFKEIILEALKSIARGLAVTVWSLRASKLKRSVPSWQSRGVGSPNAIYSQQRWTPERQLFG